MHARIVLEIKFELTNSTYEQLVKMLIDESLIDKTLDLVKATRKCEDGSNVDEFVRYLPCTIASLERMLLFGTGLGRKRRMKKARQRFILTRENMPEFQRFILTRENMPEFNAQKKSCFKSTDMSTAIQNIIIIPFL